MTVRYKVAIFLEALLSTSEEVAPALFFRELEMPFPPSVGLAMSLAGDWFCGPLERVEWHGDNCFVCYVAADTSLTDPSVHSWDRLSQEDLSSVLSSRGWQRYVSGAAQPSFFGGQSAA